MHVSATSLVCILYNLRQQGGTWGCALQAYMKQQHNHLPPLPPHIHAILSTEQGLFISDTLCDHTRRSCNPLFLIVRNRRWGDGLSLLLLVGNCLHDESQSGHYVPFHWAMETLMHLESIELPRHITFSGLGNPHYAILGSRSRMHGIWWGDEPE